MEGPAVPLIQQHVSQDLAADLHRNIQKTQMFILVLLLRLHLLFLNWSAV